jgi:predicted nucleic acid-binding protein
MRVDVSFDTSVLLYALSDDALKSGIVRQLLVAGGCISVQVLNEFVNVTRRKLRLDWDDIGRALGALREFCDVPRSITLRTHEMAVDLAQRYGYRIYDSLIIASALEAGCTTLYSEDMQHGQRIGALTIRNPFVAH